MLGSPSPRPTTSALCIARGRSLKEAAAVSLFGRVLRCSTATLRPKERARLAVLQRNTRLRTDVASAELQPFEVWFIVNWILNGQ